MTTMLASVTAPLNAEEMARVSEEAARVMQRAKTHIAIYHPFFGALIERLKLKCDPRHPTMYTDAVVIGYNPLFVRQLLWEEIVFIQLHEVMHCALRHPFRRGTRDPEVWGEAIDHVANLALLADPEVARYRPRAGSVAGAGLADPRFEGMAGEQVYSILFAERAQQEQQEPGDEKEGEEPGEGMPGATGKAGDCLDAGASGEEPEHPESEESEEEEAGDASDADAPSDGSRLDHSQAGSGEQEEEEEGEGQGQGEEEGEQEEQQDAPPEASPAPLDPNERDRLEREWSEAVSSASLAQGTGMGGEGKSAMVRALGEAGAVRRSFEEYVDEFAQKCFATDETWKRPNRRYSDTYLPSRSQPGVKKLIVGVDTSGSISGDYLARFGIAIGKVAEQFDAASIEIAYCDARVHRVESFAKGDQIRFEPAGGGGTRFEPVFEYALEQIEQGEEVAGVIYLTDLEGRCKDAYRFRDIETLWVSTQMPGPKGSYSFAMEPEFGRVCTIHD